jgi:hypothetical protein
MSQAGHFCGPVRDEREQQLRMSEVVWTSPPRCHVTSPVLPPDGYRHRCDLSVGHHRPHRCLCERDFDEEAAW